VSRRPVLGALVSVRIAVLPLFDRASVRNLDNHAASLRCSRSYDFSRADHFSSILPYRHTVIESSQASTKNATIP
jgi:hypothetical protein